MNRKSNWQSSTIIAAILVPLVFGWAALRDSSSHPEDSKRLPCTRQPNQKSSSTETTLRFDGCRFSGSLQTPENSARHFLEFYEEVLKLEHGLGDLVTEDVRQTGVSAHTRFTQTVQGQPVFGSTVQVNQDVDGSIVSLHMVYFSDPSIESATRTLTPAEALSAAMDAVGASELRLPEKHREVWFVTPAGQLRAAHELWLYTSEPLGDFLMVIDGQSGKVLFQENRIAFDTGQAKIYWPNPVQHTGDTSHTDNDDQTNPALDGAQIDVVLEDLDPNTGKLIGNWVDVTLPGGMADANFADEPSRVYEYDRDDTRFEEVNVYYTVHKVVEYIHFLGFDDQGPSANGIRDFPNKANAHWYESDNSFYSTGNDGIHFGQGGVDDAEDGDIIVHEFGHAIQHDQNSCWGGGEMGAMGEGFSDYLAATFFASTGDSSHQNSHAACVGEWDAVSYSSTNPPCLRRVDGPKTYPDDLVGAVHPDGEIWSAFLWAVRSSLGGPTTDQIVLQHHFGLPCQATMPIAALEMIQADANLNGGANEAVIRTAACNRGFLSGSDCAPPSGLALSLVADPSPAATGATVTYTAQVTNNSDGAMSSILVTAAVPAGATYVANSAGNGGSEDQGIVQWPTFNLTAGASAQRSFQVDVVVQGGGGFFDDMNWGDDLWSVSHGAGTADWVLSTTNPFGGSGSRSKVPTSVVGQTACVNGKADVFNCHRIDLDQYLPTSAMGGGDGNDGWGWTDPDTNREYYLAGLQGGTAFLDITDPAAPVYLGTLPTHTSNSDWRDIKVIGNHAYIVSEATGHGMQVFDLTLLKGVTTPQTFNETAHYGQFGNAHNIVANAATDFVYAVGVSNCSGGLHMIDVSTPTSPAFAGCYSGDGYTHDAQCLVYTGPDAAYSGREICFAFNEDTLTIVDVEDKSNPTLLSKTAYSGGSYTHQGWATADHRYILLNDELDEMNSGHNTRTHILDVSDLDQPTVVSYYEGALAAIDHNLYLDGDFVYEANYTSGLRILKMNDLAAGDLCEVASFDIYPDSDAATFHGAWNVYPYFPSGTVAVNAIEGVALLRPDLASPECVGDGGGGGGDGTPASWFAEGPAIESDLYLVTGTPISVEPGDTLEFWHSYDFETGYDGGVVEISTDGGSSWTDLGGQFTSKGYDDTIAVGYESPIGGRSAFTGNSSGYIQSIADLDPWSGQTISLRFRSTADSSVSSGGWYVDDVRAGTSALLVGTASASEAGGTSTQATTTTQVLVPECGNGILDVGEACDPGLSGQDVCCTATCEVSTGGIACRPTAGSCDVAEVCDGVTPTCPNDERAEAGFVCRSSGGVCDPEETCDGTSVACPSDQILSSGTICRAAADVCDAAETCDGVGPTCPEDQLHPAGTVCRSQAASCDAEETCSGSDVECPPDEMAPDGTPCTDGIVCTINERCEQGSCVTECGLGRACSACGNSTCVEDASGCRCQP